MIVSTRIQPWQLTKHQVGGFTNPLRNNSPASAPPYNERKSAPSTVHITVPEPDRGPITPSTRLKCNNH